MFSDESGVGMEVVLDELVFYRILSVRDVTRPFSLSLSLLTLRVSRSPTLSSEFVV